MNERISSEELCNIYGVTKKNTLQLEETEETYQ